MQDWLKLFWYSIPLYLVAAIIEIIFRLKPHAFWRWCGLLCGWTAFFTHTAFLTLRTLESRQPPLFGLFASLNVFIWCLGLFYFTYSLRWHLRQTGIIILPMITWLLFIAAKAPQKEITSMPLVLKTVWFWIHVACAFISYGLFCLGGSAAILSLIGGKQLESNPALSELWDDFTYRSSAWGVSVFSVSMVSGGIWAYLAWSDYWVWTPKELWSSIIWVYYYTYLHARIMRDWQGKRARIMAVIGMMIVLFTYLGVGLLMKSSHPL
ncbi:MAG: cytochrome c biogenesis protein CcsA [Candidatus Schekmanbacteria bacterium]|nr:cytochrome c biogenesis protein CcsA [Candidatus Schekmanbacteria bacterium]